MPLVKAWPDEPRIENAVMLVPNSDSTNTNGPSERPARKKSSAPPLPASALGLRRKAKTPT